MIPNHTNRNVQTSGVAATGEFQISLNHSAHIMKILRSQLYSDKILAVLREYSANAWDANREAGRGDVPIKVVLPTVMDPTLYIRDYGPGISHEDMFSIYAQYGVSTKRGGNGQVGMLGIGSKSGFAYTDSFTVTTWQSGTQRIYAALLNNDEKGTLNLLDESESEEPDGTMIQIPVRPIDVPAFVSKAETLFLHFKPRPNINISLEPELVPEVLMKNGNITKGYGSWMAVMGCIAYHIDLSQLRGINAHRGGAGDFLNRLDGLLYFDIGEIEIAASREGLEYSDKTKAALIDKLIDLVDEFVKHTLDKIEEGDFTFWEKRCRAQVLHDLNLPIPKIMNELTDSRIDIGEPKSFIVTYGQKQSTVRYINVGSKVRLLIKDENKKVDGYGLSSLDYVIRRNKDANPEVTLDDVRKELEEVIEKAKIFGIQVLNISTLPWHSKAKFSVLPTKKTNKKHQVRTFVLTSDRNRGSRGWSSYWDIEDRTPQPDDIYVILQSFKVRGENGVIGVKFYEDLRADRRLLDGVGIPMPKVYGYKTSEKNQVDDSKLQGKDYYQWRKEYFEQVVRDPKVETLASHMLWHRLISRSRFYRSYYSGNDSKISSKALATLFTRLGKNHPLCEFLRKVMVARRELKRASPEKLSAIHDLLTRLQDDKEEAEDQSVSEQQEALNKITDSYPMMTIFNNGINELLNENNIDVWIDYIQTVDRDKKGLSVNERTIAHDHGRDHHGSVEGEAPYRKEGSSELQESHQCDQAGEDGRKLGEDRGSLDGSGYGEGVVEREVRTDRGYGDLLRAASS